MSALKAVAHPSLEALSDVVITAPANGDVLTYENGLWVNGSGGGGGTVSSVSNADGTLTISPTTGAVIASLNQAHDFTFTGTDVFTKDITVHGATVGLGLAGISTNTAMGIGALGFNTSGSTNTAVGYQALQHNTIGVDCVAIGAGALAASTTSPQTVAIGSGALNAQTTSTGNGNIGIGASVMSLLTTGYHNIGIGNQCMINCDPAIVENVSLGNQSLHVVTGIQNTAVGHQAGFSVTSGNGNEFFGRNAGFNVTSGSYNIIVSSFGAVNPGGFGISSGSYNTLIGGAELTNLTSYLALSDGLGNLGFYYNASGGTPASNLLLAWDSIDGENKYINIGAGLTYTHATHTLSSAGSSGGGSPTLAATAVGFGDPSNLLTGDATNFYYNSTTRIFNAGFSTNGTFIKLDDINRKIALTAIHGVGINSANPSAQLQIGVGTAAASTAPLKFTTGGTLLTTPESMAMETTNSHIYWTDNSGTRYQLDQQGTLNAVSVASANGLAGTSATSGGISVLTLSTTVTGILKGNGTTISAAAGGTDYSIGTSALSTGIIKSTTGTGVLSTAIANIDFQLPIILTTSGVTGAATFNGTTLNIPQYAAGSGNILIGGTTITGGTNTRILYDNAGVVGEYTTTGTGTVVVLATAPTMTNPVVGTQAASDNSTKAASTAYTTAAIAAAVSGINPAIAVNAATNAILPNSPTYLNGVGGIGATITAGVTNTALVVDGFTPTLNQRILVKNEASGGGLGAADNGVYFVSQVAALGLAWILTRALDYDMPSDINNTGAIPVVSGTVNASTTWVLTSQITTVGTDPLTYTQFSVNPTTIITTSTSAGGDLGGTYPNPTVLQLTGAKNLVEQWGGNDINSSIGNNTYTIMLYAEYGMTINELKIIAGAGSCTAAVKIGSTAVTGISAVSVTTSIATGTASGANTVVAGNTVVLVLSSTSSLNNLQWTLKTTRT